VSLVEDSHCILTAGPVSLNSAVTVSIATTTLDSNHPESFYDVLYTIPAALTAGKDKVTIRFQTLPGNTAGGVFGVRTLKSPSP
jgi:hypothetical protein